ncbi:TetR/AcrR family transcriptional regulator [Rhizobium sp. TRM95796]|uniref:TetR/AcrR family transcriptional regulator n=1 Tax=Rhizobium sp. TRM95796 TaxID=2979862 RepID=UPI0021E831FF|nr:TetR/AcrR family transcriptional regulator [Rhizobium sp. TRM95796]MCV3764605.1 TetR/AcrR family transcriptional regulator [Rhizobium sp. TRM95796]
MAGRRTRSEIVAAADELFYRMGFEPTSFADIAEKVNISRGNFYHHFKTKDEILNEVIQKRAADRRTMLDAWEQEESTPERRIARFIDILAMNCDKIRLHGCPIGTLTGELAKLDHPAREEATALFTLFRNWLSRQFAQLVPHKEADRLAMELLARSQGAATLYNAFRDDNFLRREIAAMKAWLAGISAGRKSAHD